jgi:uncharacterized membrane protein (UPF0127 family)
VSVPGTTTTLDPVTTATGPPATTSPPTTTTDPPVTSPAELEAFGRATVDLNGRSWRVAVADTPELRSQGLMRVTDLGDVDGMLFVYEELAPVSFWMKDTVIALDVAFFDGDGKLFLVLEMEPCREDPCPSYASREDTQWALEAPAGVLRDLPVGSLLTVSG